MTPTIQTAWTALCSGQFKITAINDKGGRRTISVARTYRPLSPREASVARAVACGYSLVAICEAMGVAPSTVATYLGAAAAKLGTNINGVRYLLPGSASTSLKAALRGPALPRPDGARWVGGALFRDQIVRGQIILPLASPGLPAGLTGAEADVLRRRLRGERAKAIAEARGTSRRTVANQLSAIYAKCGVRTGAGLDPAMLADLEVTP